LLGCSQAERRALPSGSLLDFLKSEEGNKQPLPKLIDFSAQVSGAQIFLSFLFHLSVLAKQN